MLILLLVVLALNIFVYLFPLHIIPLFNIKDEINVIDFVNLLITAAIAVQIYQLQKHLTKRESINTIVFSHINEITSCLDDIYDTTMALVDQSISDKQVDILYHKDKKLSQKLTQLKKELQWAKLKSPNDKIIIEIDNQYVDFRDTLKEVVRRDIGILVVSEKQSQILKNSHLGVSSNLVRLLFDIRMSD